MRSEGFRVRSGGFRCHSESFRVRSEGFGAHFGYVRARRAGGRGDAAVGGSELDRDTEALHEATAR